MTNTTGYVLDDPDKGIFRVHRATMVSPEVLEEERRLIFDRCWLYVGHEAEVAAQGDFRTRTVGGRPLIFCRNKDGIDVFYNTCRHRGALVCREREGNGRFFRCFYHAWSYENTGRLVALPDEDGYADGFDRDAMGLCRPAKVENYRGFWFVNFDANAMSLSDYLADAKEYLDLVADQSEVGMEVVGGTQEYGIRANWKLLAENSVDGYHGMPTHITYFEFLIESLKSAGIELNLGAGGGGNPANFGFARALGNGHAVIEYRAPWGRPVAQWAPPFPPSLKPVVEEKRARLVELYGEERAARMAETSRNMIIFPNLVINDIMAITIRVFEPQAPDYMNVSAWELAPVDEIPELRAARLDNFLTFLGPGGFATPDDVEALESCQRGFATWQAVPWSDISRGMRREVALPNDELQMQSFWRGWEAHMAVDDLAALPSTPVQVAARSR